MCMGSKVLIITQQSIDPFLVKYLSEFGFPADELSIYADVEQALAVPDKLVQLVLLQLNNGGNIDVVRSLYERFSTAAIIALIEPKDEPKALELLVSGMQDYVLLSEQSPDRFKQTINNALRRKQFSVKMYEHNLQLNNEIQIQKRRLDHILSSINEVVWSCTADTFETIYINDACYSIYGFSPDEIVGNCDLLFGRIHPDDKKYYRKAWRELLLNDKCVFEYRILHKDGEIKYIKNEAVFRRDINNLPRFINGFSRDVTVQKMQMLKIQEQSEQLQEIAWIQSHKVRGPVASILGLTQLFNYEAADSNNREVINHIQTAAENLDAVIHEIVGKSN